MFQHVQLHSRPVALAWSPSSFASLLPPAQQHGSNLLGLAQLSLCVAGEDDTLLLVECRHGKDHPHTTTASATASSSSSSSSTTTTTQLGQHEGGIVGIAFSPSAQGVFGGGDKDEYLASVSGANTLCIRQVTRDHGAVTSSLLHVISLLSTPVSVAWKPSARDADDVEVVVCEARGTSTVYTLPGCTPMMSTSTVVSSQHGIRGGVLPLLGADVSGLTGCAVAGLGQQGQALLVWDALQGSAPWLVTQLPQRQRIIRWSRVSESMFACAGRDKVDVYFISDIPSSEDRITNIYTCQGQASDLSWHATSPLCMAAMGSCIVLLTPDL